MQVHSKRPFHMGSTIQILALHNQMCVFGLPIIDQATMLFTLIFIKLGLNINLLAFH